jgi:hypothetical protein
VSYRWEQSTGHVTGPDVDAYGYSGRGLGKNNPAMDGVRNFGPIPCGRYAIGAPITHEHLGIYVLPLTPLPGTNTFGRSGFFWHGANPQHPDDSSEGCPISKFDVRETVWRSGDHELEVVPGPPTSTTTHGEAV